MFINHETLFSSLFFYRSQIDSLRDKILIKLYSNQMNKARQIL